MPPSRRQTEAQGIRLSPRGAWMQRPREHTPTISLIIKENIGKRKKNPPKPTGHIAQRLSQKFVRKDENFLRALGNLERVCNKKKPARGYPRALTF